MTDKELRKLSRSDLLELLISQTEENRVLKSRVDQMQDQLLDRRIAVDKAGSIAEASLQLNGVFQAAEKAAQQYLENIQRMSEEQDTIGRNIRAKATEEAEAIRGVKVDGVVNTLLDLGLIAEAGRKKALGNPILYATTEKFLTVFGLPNLESLPPIFCF